MRIINIARVKSYTFPPFHLSRWRVEEAAKDAKDECQQSYVGLNCFASIASTWEEFAKQAKAILYWTKLFTSLAGV